MNFGWAVVLCEANSRLEKGEIFRKWFIWVIFHKKCFGFLNMVNFWFFLFTIHETQKCTLSSSVLRKSCKAVIYGILFYQCSVCIAFCVSKCPQICGIQSASVINRQVLPRECDKLHFSCHLLHNIRYKDSDKKNLWVDSGITAMLHSELQV